jgi:hypothetical protein
MATTSPSIAESLGLSGLTVLPAPTTDIAATIQKYADDRLGQLHNGDSSEEFLIFYGASSAHVHALEAAKQQPGRMTFFGDKSGLLFVKMTHILHEFADGLLLQVLADVIARMGLRHAWLPTGRARFEPANPDNPQKEGDFGLRPIRLRTGNQFPTLVHECGNSQSVRALRKAKDWWFDNSSPTDPHGDVKVVLLTKVFRGRKELVIEQWHRDRASASAVVSVKPHPEKEFVADIPVNMEHWVVEGGPMRIAFEDVFLRDKSGHETDLVLTDEILVTYAVMVWLGYGE